MLLQAVFPNVMAPEVLEGLRAMTADVFEAVDVPEKMRYQGSSINVLTPEAWEAAGSQEGMLHDPLVEQLNQSPRQVAVAEAIGLENLRGGGALLILSKPAHGPPLYWHQASSSSSALFFAQALLAQASAGQTVMMCWAPGLCELELAGRGHALAHLHLLLLLPDGHQPRERLPPSRAHNSSNPDLIRH